MGLIFSNIPELEGTNTEIALANLTSLESDLCNVFERRIAHLCELAHAIVKDGGDSDLIKSIMLSIRSNGEVDSDDICPESISELKALFANISSLERAVIFKQVFDLIPNVKYNPSDRSEYISLEAFGRIAYLQNSYNDVAFDHFATVLRDAKASYYDSVNDICESVVLGKDQFCILPIETFKDGKLITFYNTIIKNNLKINAEFDLDNPDGAGFTRYALIGGSEVLPKNQILVQEKNRYLEIAYSDTDNLPLGELIIASEYFGLELNCIDTLTLHGNEKNILCIEFEASHADIQNFMTYLSVDCPEHILIGIYRRN